jgi:hypothetical protein
VYEKEQQAKRKQSLNALPETPYFTILKQCLPQCFNVFFVFFVTLSIFPAVHSGEFMLHIYNRFTFFIKIYMPKMDEMYRTYKGTQIFTKFWLEDFFLKRLLNMSLCHNA